MEDAKWYGNTLSDIMNRDDFTLNAHVGAPEMLKRCDDGNASCVDEATVMVDEVNVRTDLPALLTGNNAERFSIKGVGAPDGLFDEAREEGF